MQVLICRMLYNYLPGRATPPNLGVNIPGSSQHTYAGLCLTSLSHSVMGLSVLIYTLEVGEALMESTSCPRMLHSQPTGSSEIGTFAYVIYIEQVVDVGLFIQLVSIFCLLEFLAERIKGHGKE